MKLRSGAARWLAVAAAVALGGGGVAYAIITAGDDSAAHSSAGGTAGGTTTGAGPDAPSTAEVDTPSSTRTADPALFREAFDGKVTMRCAYDESGIAGTAYLKGRQQIRIDYTSADRSDGHILKTGDAVYLWGAALPQGLKLDQAAGNQELSELLDGIAPEKLASQTKDAACTEYSGDRSVFAVPTDVEFTEPPAQG